MNHHLTLLTRLLLLFILVISCAEEKKDSSAPINVIKQPINPNGDSELALLMRAMFEEAQAVKTQIDNGEPISIELKHENILTADATEPEKAASQEYQAFAQSYLESIKNLQTANPEDLVGMYDNMVVNCMACHKTLCPGPIVKIKKLQ